MTDDTTALTTTDQDTLRKQAILRAVGLDRVPAEQRELALAIANRYDLDLMLKHLVLIDGRPYITRDALLWVAHRSGAFNGIVATEPIIKDFPGLGQCWYSEVTVWRKDMQHPITYGGRYPVNGQNRKFGPEMAIKVGECMALRRAFNVSAATVEERWEQDDDDRPTPEPPRTLAQVVEARVAEVAQAAAEPEPAPEPLQRPTTPVFGETLVEPQPEPETPVQPVVEGDSEPEDIGALPEPMFGDVPAADPAPEPPSEFVAKMAAAGTAKPDKPARRSASKPPAQPTTQVVPPMPSPDAGQCPETSPFGGDARCRLHVGHKGAHRSSPNESWGPKIVD